MTDILEFRPFFDSEEIVFESFFGKHHFTKSGTIENLASTLSQIHAWPKTRKKISKAKKCQKELKNMTPLKGWDTQKRHWFFGDIFDQKYPTMNRFINPRSGPYTINEFTCTYVMISWNVSTKQEQFQIII